MSLAEFFRAGWHVCEPGIPLQDSWHIDALCDHVQAALEDWYAVVRWQQRAAKPGHDPIADPRPEQRIKDMAINISPGTAKSRIVSVYAPAWMWLLCPSWRAIFISGNPRVASRDSAYCRMLIQSDWYQNTFKPAWKFAPDQNAKTFYRNTARGQRMAIGAGAVIVGDRADALFVDDLNDPSDVESDTKRTSRNDWWDQSAGSRVNDLRTSPRIGIQQRTHEDDWTGHVLPLGTWFHLSLPMEYERQNDCKCASCTAGVSPIGWSDPRTVDGELMMPNRFPKEVLAAELLRLGSNGYAGQYQQRPAAKGGTIFKEQWFADRYQQLPKLKFVWTCWDTALKDEEQNDESACVTMAEGEDGDVYVLYAAHGRWETPDLMKFLIARAYWYKSRYGALYAGDYVEDKVSGTTLMQYVKRHVDEDRTRAHDGCKLALIAVQVEADKVARAQGVSPICEAKRVHLPDTAFYPETFSWTRDLLAVLTRFPKVKKKDLVDAFVYGLKKYLGTLSTGKKGRRSKRGGVV